MKIAWTDEYVSFLIDKVKNAEFMWNVRLPTYKKKKGKHKFWLFVTEALNSHFNPSIQFEIAEVQRKWNNLKSYFMMQKKQKAHRAQESGASAEEIEVNFASWKFRQALDFLSSTTISTLSINNFNENSLHIFTNNEKTEANSTSISSSPSSRVPSPLATPLESQKFDRIRVKLQTQLTETPLPSELKQTPENRLTALLPSSISSPLTSTVVAIPTQTTNTTSQLHLRKREKTTNENQAIDTLSNGLMESSNTSTQALTAKVTNNASKENNANVAFGAYISAELNKLDEDLQVEGKRNIFNILMDLQQQQLQRMATQFCTV